ncbi:hypothetical protein DICA2_C01816 [Diutina catenulata]
MPEVGEVAHAVALLKRNIVGASITKVEFLVEDTIIFPYTESSEFSSLGEKLTGAKVEAAGRHGKYFWLRLSCGMLLMHFGMTGMIKLHGLDSHLIFMENGGDKKVKNGEAVQSEGDAEWPPRFTKFQLWFDNDIELAFRDPRRLARVKFFESVLSEEELMAMAPLKVLGPDYSKTREPIDTPEPFVFGDPDPHHHGRPIPNLEEFSKVVATRKKPLKSLLLDQNLFAGVGNWVADEVCFQSRIHPNEVVSSKVDASEGVPEVIATIYEKLIEVCSTAVRVEGDVKQYPDDWLMLHRWGKGRKEKAEVLGGHKVDHMTIGGRTSCFVPDLQKMLPRVKAEPTTETKVVKARVKKEVKQEKTAVKREIEEVETTRRTRVRRAVSYAE